MFCPYCGEELSEGQAFCQHCGARIAGAGPGPVAVGRSKTPWEGRETVGFFPALFRTAKEVLFSPSAFFRKMPVTGGLTDPLLFGLIVGMAGLMFFYLWDIMLHDSMQKLMTPEIREAAGRSGLFSSVATALMPFMVILWIFIASGMLHVFLLMVRGAQAGFEATFRVICFSLSPFLFMVIPYCGMPVTMFWVMILTIIGLKEAHETTGGKSAFAVLFPFLFCCGLIMLILLLFMGAVAASFGALMNMQH